MSLAFGKIGGAIRDGPQRAPPGHPAPAPRGPSGLEPSPPQPRKPHPPRGAGCSDRQGAPGPRVGLGPRLLGRRGSVHPEAELQTQRPGAQPSSAPARGPREQPPDPRGLGAPSPVSRESPAPLSAQRHLDGTALAPGWAAVPSSRGSPRLSPVSDAKPSPPPRRPAPAARLPSSPGPQTEAPHLRPRTAGPSAACRPSAEPSARALRPQLCDRPKLAARRGWLPEENRAGCPAGHPRPPVSGGDPSGAGTEGRGQQILGRRRASVLAPPGRRGDATGRLRRALPGPVLREPSFGATRRSSPAAAS